MLEVSSSAIQNIARINHYDMCVLRLVTTIVNRKQLIAIRKIGIGNRLLNIDLSGNYKQKLLAIRHAWFFV